jgi:hypothetical protein
MKYPVAGLCPRVGLEKHAQPRGEARGKVEATQEHDLGGRGTMGKRAGVGRAEKFPACSHVTAISPRPRSRARFRCLVSGRKHHFIQKFLLKGFSPNPDAKIPQTWVYRRDGKIFPTALEGYAAERDFYGDPALDTQITNLETKQFTGFLTELRAGVDRRIDPEAAATFAVQAFARCKSYRTMIADSLEPMMAEANATIRTVEFQTRMLMRAIGENSTLLAAAISSPLSFEAFARQRVERNHGATLDLLRKSEAGVRSAVAAWQNQAIRERLDFGGSRRDQLCSLFWHCVSVTSGSLILGDTVVTAELADGTFKPVHEPGDSLVRVWLPIATNLAMVGSITDAPPTVDAAAINRGSAACSYEAFCAHEGPEVRKELISLIRTGTFTLTREQIQATIANALSVLV